MEIDKNLIDFEGVKNFKKNNPQFKHDNIYVCQSVDMDGNIVDTKYGANIVTDYGLNRMMCDGYSYAGLYMYLGSGDTDPTYGPTDSHSLNSYISALGGKAASDTWYVAKKDYVRFSAFEYDPVTKIQSTSQPVARYMWNYTDGSNQLYTIREIGLASNNDGVNKIYMHALIYDSLGQKSYIEKKPNTRLFITFYVTYGASFADVPSLYDQGVYVYLNALQGHPYKHEESRYLGCIMRCNCYKTGTVEYWRAFDDKDIKKGGSRYSFQRDSSDVQRIRGGIWATSEQSSFFWEDPGLYSSGFIITNNYSNLDSDDMESLTDLTTDHENGDGGGWSMVSYERMPEPEELETFYATSTASNDILPYNSDYNYDAARVNWYYNDLQYNFGVCNPNSPVEWVPTSGESSYNLFKYWPRGAHLPCTNFDITELNMYNHITKDYDIDIDYTSDPDFEYMDNYLRRSYTKQYVHFDGVDKWVYAFTFPRSYGNITKFSNTGITICATDAYWDPSTYEAGRIADLTNIPVELQTKRYYVITSGNVQKLSPTYTGWNNRHKIVLPSSRQAFEFPRELQSPNFYNCDNDTSSGVSYVGCKPIINQTNGFFVTPDKIIYLDSDNDTSNAVSYPISIQGYSNRLSRLRRYLTEDGDKLLIFNGYYGYWNNSWRTESRTTAKNHFVIYTITDKNTAPTAVEYDLTFQNTSSMENDTYHKYTWTRKGFLVAQKQIGGDEAVVVDVYGDQASNYEPTQHSILNAKHCFALDLTENCVYYDPVESDGTAFLFKIYDMKNRTVIDTFTINDSTAYTIEGIYGWREFIYVQVIANSVRSTYLYNSDTHMLQKLNSDFWFSIFSSTDMNQWGHYVAIDDCLIWCRGKGYYGKLIVIRADDPANYHYLYNSTFVADSCHIYTYYPCIGTCNNGKQLILTYITNNRYTAVVDLGLFLDQGEIRHATCADDSNLGYDRCCVSYHYNDTNSVSLDGSVFPFNDGIISLSANAYDSSHWSKYGRMWWQPIECKLPLHMKGTTYTVNAYNNPIKWWGKGGSYSFTNNIDKYNNNGE